MTPKNTQTILVGEDEREVRGYLEMALKCLGYGVELAQDGDEVLACLQTSRADIAAVLLDIMMPNRDGIDTLREIRKLDPTVPVIIVSAASSSVNIVAAMKAGANDFLCKPVEHDDLRKAISRVTELRSTEYSKPSKNPAPNTTKSFVGSNSRMKEIQTQIRQIGWSEAPVLIQGETGTGKEVTARELHAQSPRAGKPFLKLNCAALPSELVESELFGYERGAFTGAFQKKVGMFELADGGTILLDEIGDMDIRLQAKLLQVLQDQEFQRIGGKEMVKVDVRVMAATHRDLEQLIVDREFREDLYYRLNVINLLLPPLRERKEDIVPLAEFLLKRHGGTTDEIPVLDAMLKHAMRHYQWPGNVRELENFVRRFIIFRDSAVLVRELQAKSANKPVAVKAVAAIQDPVPEALGEPQKQVDIDAPILEQVTIAKHRAETEAILAALNSTRWNRKQAAALLKIDYKALLYKMKKLGVEDSPAPFRAKAETSEWAAAVGR